MNKSKKILSFVILSIVAIFQLSFVFNVNKVLAGPFSLDKQEGMDRDTGIGKSFGTEEPRDIREIVASYIKIFLGFLGIIFLILMIFAGFKYFMSKGEAAETKKAVDLMRTAVIGLAIILASMGITTLVENSLQTAMTATT